MISSVTTSANSFEQTLERHKLILKRSKAEILQINLGKLCNLTCVHCHVNAGPHRKELMSAEALKQSLDWFEATDIPTLDLTGGTPEMHPQFQELVERVRSFERPREIMTRLNATILNEPGFEWVAEFHAMHQITAIASMPCYSPENVNEQRGNGVFDSSIRAFQRLNELGYGKDPALKLHFVYNPNGAFLPSDQAELQTDYKREMAAHFGIEFNDLFCITNMPIARYASYLKRNGQLADYYQLLQDNFNPASIEGLMCRNTINVDWEGRVFDCDFNQQLGMQLQRPCFSGNKQEKTPLMLWDIELDTWQSLEIQTAKHCFGCTAGAGSSCGGALV